MLHQRNKYLIRRISDCGPFGNNQRTMISNNQINFIGWILFILSALGFIIASIGNFWGMVGLFFFLVACLVFLIPFFRTDK
jgi:hypothetical protein